MRNSAYFITLKGVNNLKKLLNALILSAVVILMVSGTAYAAPESAKFSVQTDPGDKGNRVMAGQPIQTPTPMRTDFPTMPGLPAAPTFPTVPNIPEMPVVPEIPVVPEMPVVPAMPGMDLETSYEIQTPKDNYKELPVYQGEQANNGSNEEAKIRVCEKVIERAKNKLNKYEDKKVKKLERYEETKSKIYTILDEMDINGEDTSEARKDIEAIDAKVEDLVTQVDELVAKWSAKEVNCSDTSQYDAVRAEFRTDVKTVKGLISEIRAMAREVADMLRSTYSSSIAQ